MSRIGLSPITIPKDVTVTINESTVRIEGPKGIQNISLSSDVKVNIEASNITISRLDQNTRVKAVHGAARSLIANSIIGVTKGWQKELELVGVGYRAKVVNNNLEVVVGFSHPVIVSPPKEITFEVQKERIIISGIDKYLVGQIAANIRAIKKPEPYKGKGIKYSIEHVRKKAGKTAKAIGGSGGGK